jgi:hypothetical protein
MNKFLFLSISIITILFSSCVEEKRTLKLLKVTEYSSSKVSDSALIKILKEDKDLDIDISYTLFEEYALNQLNEKKVDLVIIPNNVVSNNLKIKAITTLLPRILMIFTNKRTEVTDLKELFEAGTVYFEDRSILDSVFFKKLYYNFNIDEKKITSKTAEEINFNTENDSLMVYVGLTHINNILVKKMTDHNWSFFSIGDIDNFGKGSRVEGFTMMNTSSYPFVLPKSVYRGKPEKSILTIAIKDILICREDLDENVAYQIPETLIENKSHLIYLNSAYNLLDFDFENQVLSFPLHQGTRNYLERNKPSIWMRYVNMAWPILSILVIFIGALTSFNRKLRKKRKENIEKYYSSLLLIREKSEHLETSNEMTELLHELRTLKSKAIESLANNKFDSGESFNIFLALYTEIKSDLDEDLERK